MSFLAMVRKNLLRRPIRSGLTALGIAVGIGAVVGLLGLSWGFERAMADTYRARRADLIVRRSSGRSPVPGRFPQETVERLKQFSGVQAAAGLMTDVMSVDEIPLVLILGWPLDSFLWDHLTLEKGRWPRSETERAIVLGTFAAETLGKTVGDSLVIDVEDLPVCGIYSSEALAENGGIVMTLGQAQTLTNQPGMVNTAVLVLDPSLTPAQVIRLREAIRREMPGFDTLDARQLARTNLAVQAARAMTLATSVIGLAVGAIGVANTILMSVFERVSEIGVLLAIGWRRRRIVQMILLESLALCLAGGIAGTAAGLAGVRALLRTPWLRGAIAVDLSWPLLVIALAASTALGLLAGFYPAWRAAGMQATAALRHE